MDSTVESGCWALIPTVSQVSNACDPLHHLMKCFVQSLFNNFDITERTSDRQESLLSKEAQSAPGIYYYVWIMPCEFAIHSGPSLQTLYNAERSALKVLASPFALALYNETPATLVSWSDTSLYHKSYLRMRFMYQNPSCLEQTVSEICYTSFCHQRNRKRVWLPRD